MNVSNCTHGKTGPKLRPASDGTAENQRLQRHYSYSDRIRYYWTDPAASAATAAMLADLGATPIPEPLVSQHLGAAYGDVMAKATGPTAQDLLRGAVTRALEPYFEACRGQTAQRQDWPRPSHP